MDSVFTFEQIQETATFKELLNRKEHIKINLLKKREIRSIITHAFEVCKNTGIVPGNVLDHKRQIVLDLIALYRINKTDYSSIMTDEQIKFKDEK